MARSWSYEEMENEVRKLAHSIPPSDFGSTRAIQVMTHFVFDKLREASLSPRVSKLEAALTYIERETGSPLKAPAAACELAHNVASEALKRN